MDEFSLKKCAELLNISDDNRSEWVKELYLNVDKLVWFHRNYLKKCVFDAVYECICEVDRDVWKGILFAALRMAIESELGGAVKQENPNDIGLFGADKKCCYFNVEWISSGIGLYCNPMIFSKQQKQAEKQKIQKCIENGERYAHDLRQKFEIYCDMGNSDSARLSPKSCYLIGSELCLKGAMENNEVAEKFALAFEMYSQMTPKQRLNDFNRLRQKIQEINQSDPFMIMIGRWNQNGGDNQGRGHSRS